MAVDDYYYWISGHQSHRRAHLEPDLVFHQVRHPLAAIGSLATMNKGGFWHWQEKHTGISGDMDRVVRAARFWLEWNRICEAQRPDFTYRIEDLPWVELCARLGLRHQPLPGISRGLGKSSKAEPLSWDELAKRTGPIGERVMERARDYGYEE